MSAELQELRDRFVETGGHISQSVGLGRSIGQIFAHIYLNPEPQSLDDLTRTLQISKGGASMAVRQLVQWGALKPVWVKGDRRDYYVATEDFGRIIRRAMLDLIGQRMEVTDRLLEDSERMISEQGGDGANPDLEFMERRINTLRVFRNRAQSIWDSSIVRLLLK